MNVTFNIIYVGGTVDLLLPFLYTLLEHSRCNYQLVSNGCSQNEEATLEKLCKSSQRLSYYSLASNKIIEHGIVLNHLLDINTSDIFAIMDSDIFANGPFLEPHLSLLENNNVAVFSALPTWHMARDRIMPASYQIMGGRYIQAHTGLSLGVSYYGIYHAPPLKELIRDMSVSFQVYGWNDLPDPVKEELITLELKKNIYDTGKILNIFLQHRGHNIQFTPSPHLVHIGAISGASAVKQSKKIHWRQYLYSHLPIILQDRIRQIRYGTTLSEAKDIRDLAMLRQVAQNYVNSCILDSVTATDYLTQAPREVRDKIESAGLHIREIYSKQKPDFEIPVSLC